MKELLKSFGYTVAGIATIVVVVVAVCLTMDALARVNPNLQNGFVAVFMLVLFTAIVHTIRRGK